MDERAALAFVGGYVDAAGDDCAVVDDLVVTTDMLHETTDFPDGTTRYTAGWRAVGASLSDVAAMGAAAVGAVAVYAAPTFDAGELGPFLEGCVDVCEAVGTDYVGGDLDRHEEFTVSTTALGRTDDPVFRDGATPGEAVCVTGTLGRSAVGVRLFETDRERANELFRFPPRVAAGVALAPHATAMIDSSDGLARSLYQIAEASDCGVSIAFEDVPVHPELEELADAEYRELAVGFGEDFELVVTIPETELEDARGASPVALSRIGTVTDDGIEMDGKVLENRGYTH